MYIVINCKLYCILLYYAPIIALNKFVCKLDKRWEKKQSKSSRPVPQRIPRIVRSPSKRATPHDAPSWAVKLTGM